MVEIVRNSTEKEMKVKGYTNKGIFFKDDKDYKHMVSVATTKGDTDIVLFPITDESFQVFVKALE